MTNEMVNGLHRQIPTHTGRLVTPLALRIEDFDIRDMARGLSNMCRYSGQSEFYSVAEHTVRVSESAQVRSWSAGGPGCTGIASVENARYGFAHDLEETYLPDLPAPLKVLPEFAFYREAGHRASDLIHRWLGLDPDDKPAIINTIDKGIIGSEARSLFAVRHPNWILPDGAKVRDMGWSPVRARKAFLQRFAALWPDHKIGG